MFKDAIASLHPLLTNVLVTKDFLYVGLWQYVRTTTSCASGCYGIDIKN